MLKVKLAEKFIEKLTAYTRYNINIMDDRGIIIASRDPERVGTFHEIAYYLISQGKEIMEVAEDDNYVGTKMGVNTVFNYQNKPIGVVGLTGKPEEVREIAFIVRMALETMMEYEISQEKNYKRKGIKAYFLNCLLYGGVDKNELKELCHCAGYDRKPYRVPVLINCEKTMDLEEVLEHLKMSGGHDKQDISLVTRDGHILVYKVLWHLQINAKMQYREMIQYYIEDMKSVLKTLGLKGQFYIGSIQNNMEDYGMAYQHALWLAQSFNEKREVLWFYDFIEDYMKSKIPFTEFYKVFNVFDELLDEKTKENIVELVGPLHRNNYNLIETSQALYIHRNTLVFRLNRVKHCLGINPMKEEKDRAFLSYLNTFFHFLGRD